MNDVTHLGLQDIPMMSNIPNLVYLAPTTKEEYLAMLDWSIDQDQYQMCIRDRRISSVDLWICFLEHFVEWGVLVCQ